MAGHKKTSAYLISAIAIASIFTLFGMTYVAYSLIKGGAVANAIGLSKEPVVKCTAYEVFNDYSESITTTNIAKADAKYLGKYVQVVGKVLKVEKHGSYYWVGLETGPNLFPVGQTGVIVKKSAIVAEIPESERELISKLNEFDAVVFQGVCGGKKKDTDRMKDMLILFTNAKIVKHVTAADVAKMESEEKAKSKK